MDIMPAKPIKFVAAIDFGTTYSGYAFSSVDNYRKNKLNIKVNTNWDYGSLYKAPTCILLQPNGDYNFGTDAENRYKKKLLDKDENSFHFFRRFKMELNGEKLHLNTKIKDIRGQKHNALDVFTKSVIFLRDQCLQRIKDEGHTPDKEEVKWCISVPAIWSDEAKCFMRKVCEQADIPRNRIQIVLEPEVASLYCQTWYSEEHKGNKNLFQPGTKCLVVDLGGGTVDICGHEIQEKGMFRQICKASGNDFGGVAVDRAFMHVIEIILGHDIFNEFKNKYTKSYMTILDNFEMKKRQITRELCELIIELPFLNLNKVCKLSNFKEMVKASAYSEQMEVGDDAVVINRSLIETLFTEATEKLISTIKGVLQIKDARDIKLFLLVGGFADSIIVREAIKKSFPDMDLITPPHPSLAILHGSVLYGHQPDVVTTRVTRFAYGRKIKPLFNSGIHEAARKVEIDGECRCDSVFELLIEANTAVPVSKTISKPYHTVAKFQSKIHVALFKSAGNATRYVDETDCYKIGECWIDIPNPSEKRRIVDVDFVFGETELFVKATDRHTQQMTTELFNLE